VGTLAGMVTTSVLIQIMKNVGSFVFLLFFCFVFLSSLNSLGINSFSSVLLFSSKTVRSYYIISHVLFLSF
jgi:hypothetical protein